MARKHAFISFHKLGIQEQNIMLKNVVFQFRKNNFVAFGCECEKLWKWTSI
jgi:hypothetical protein